MLPQALGNCILLVLVLLVLVVEVLVLGCRKAEDQVIRLDLLKMQRNISGLNLCKEKQTNQIIQGPI